MLFIGSTKIVSHFLRNFVEREVLFAPPIGGRSLCPPLLGCRHQLSRFVRDRAHAHKRMHDTVAWSQKAKRQSKRWPMEKKKKLSISKSTRTNCYRYYIFIFLVFFCVKVLGRVVMSYEWDWIDRKVKLTRVWFTLCFLFPSTDFWKGKAIVDLWFLFAVVVNVGLFCFVGWLLFKNLFCFVIDTKTLGITVQLKSEHYSFYQTTNNTVCT